MRYAISPVIFLLFTLSVSGQEIVTKDGTPLQACGLFGPSKKDLMREMIRNQQEHIAVHREGNQALYRMEVEQARQTEILRQIAGQVQRSADSSQRAADSGAALSQHLLTKPLRDYPALPSDAPKDLRNSPVVAPTLPDLRGVAPLPSDAPGNLTTEGSILRGTSGRVYYTNRGQRR